MLPFIFVTGLAWLLLPAVSSAHPAQRDSVGVIAVAEARSLPHSSSYPAIDNVVAAQNLEARAEEALHNYDSHIITKRQSMLPIDALNLSSLTPDTFNLTEAPPGHFNLSGSDIDEFISFDEKIPLPIWPAIYFRVKGELDDQMECTAELWVHVVFNYELITAHGNLKTGLDWNVSTKIVSVMARLYVLLGSDNYYHLMFEAIGKVYVPTKGWKQFQVLKEIWKFKDTDQATIAVPAASSVATS